mmetsp:Transcript_17957/g.20444  ORF Transcript_17957/g.20444 Transcript_17957/m.20444 type:complete len:82 (-) Transcript_17957:921-1166(-)
MTNSMHSRFENWLSDLLPDHADAYDDHEWKMCIIKRILITLFCLMILPNVMYVLMRNNHNNDRHEDLSDPMRIRDRRSRED